MSSPVRCDTCGRVTWLTSVEHDYVCRLCRAITLIRPVGPWVEDALCAEIGGDTWFPNPKGGPTIELNMARAICAQCPVRQECLDFAVENGEEHGIWGGLTPHERRPLRREWKQQQNDTPQQEGPEGCPTNAA